MRLKLPFERPKAAPPASDFFTRMFAHQRSILLTPEHEAFLKEKREREERARAEESNMEVNA